jgi:hypothetical protein
MNRHTLGAVTLAVVAAWHPVAEVATGCWYARNFHAAADAGLMSARHISGRRVFSASRVAGLVRRRLWPSVIVVDWHGLFRQALEGRIWATTCRPQRKMTGKTLGLLPKVRKRPQLPLSYDDPGDVGSW